MARPRAHTSSDDLRGQQRTFAESSLPEEEQQQQIA